MAKIIFLDFDETLYSHVTNRIPESAAIAVNKARENGVKVFLCSGRSLSEMDYFDISSVQLDGMIANNGQIGYDGNNNVLFDYPIGGELKKLILEKFNSKTVPMILNTKNTVMCNFINENLIAVQKEINSPLPPIKEYEGEDFYMASAFYSNEKDWDDLLQLKQFANITYWHDGAVDIVPNNVSKAVGIQRILDLFNIDKEDAMGIGDSENDIQMLQYCGTAIAVEKAMDSVKQVADYVCPDIDHDGIYEAFKHYKII